MPGEINHQGLPVFAEECTSEKDRDGSPTEMRARWARLTSRERQVMQLIVTGLTSREMAGQLGISARMPRSYEELLKYLPENRT